MNDGIAKYFELYPSALCRATLKLKNILDWLNL